LESVIYGLPAPPPLSSSRFRALKLAAPAKTVEPPSAPAPVSRPAAQARIAADSDSEEEAPAPSASDPVTATRPALPPTQATAVADLTPAPNAAKDGRAGQATRPKLVKQMQQFARLDAERAKQIEQLTRRAEVAEAKVRALEVRIAADQQFASALGRRFGQKPHELFPAFVARLGMTAKAEVPRGGQPD
jgi:hypothetical protein